MPFHMVNEFDVAQTILVLSVDGNYIDILRKNVIVVQNKSFFSMIRLRKTRIVTFEDILIGVDILCLCIYKRI